MIKSARSDQNWSSYWTFGVSNFRSIEPSEYRTFRVTNLIDLGVTNLRSIEPSPEPLPPQYIPEFSACRWNKIFFCIYIYNTTRGIRNYGKTSSIGLILTELRNVTPCSYRSLTSYKTMFTIHILNIENRIWNMDNQGNQPLYTEWPPCSKCRNGSLCRLRRSRFPAQRKPRNRKMFWIPPPGNKYRAKPKSVSFRLSRLSSRIFSHFRSLNKLR